MLAKSQRLGVERCHHGGASRAKLSKQRAVVAGRRLVADCMTEEAMLMLDVDNVIAALLFGNVGLEIRDVMSCLATGFGRESREILAGSPEEHRGLAA